MPTLNTRNLLWEPTNIDIQQHQAAETQPERPAADAHGVWVERDPGVLNADVVTTANTTDMLVGHHHIALTPLQDSVSALEARIGELDATNDDIYQKLDTLQELHERRLSMDNQEQVQEQVQEEKDVVISIMKTKKTTEVVVANAILESISNLVKKG